MINSRYCDLYELVNHYNSSSIGRPHHSGSLIRTKSTPWAPSRQALTLSKHRRASQKYCSVSSSSGMDIDDKLQNQNGRTYSNISSFSDSNAWVSQQPKLTTPAATAPTSSSKLNTSAPYTASASRTSVKKYSGAAQSDRTPFVEIDDETWIEARVMDLKGHGASMISRALGVNRTTLQRYLDHINLEFPSQGQSVRVRRNKFWPIAEKRYQAWLASQIRSGPQSNFEESWTLWDQEMLIDCKILSLRRISVTEIAAKKGINLAPLLDFLSNPPSEPSSNASLRGQLRKRLHNAAQERYLQEKEHRAGKSDVSMVESTAPPRKQSRSSNSSPGLPSKASIAFLLNGSDHYGQSSRKD